LTSAPAASSRAIGVERCRCAPAGHQHRLARVVCVFGIAPAFSSSDTDRLAAVSPQASVNGPQTVALAAFTFAPAADEAASPARRRSPARVVQRRRCQSAAG
jgi:hypothetical protein